MGQFLDAEPKTEFAWTRRRLFMYTVAFFCMGCVAWIEYKGIDTRVAETIVTMSFVTLIGIVGSYVFGSTWQDVTQMKQLGTRRSPEA